jgi:hypothetical protein
MQHYTSIPKIFLIKTIKSWPATKDLEKYPKLYSGSLRKNKFLPRPCNKIRNRFYTFDAVLSG